MLDIKLNDKTIQVQKETEVGKILDNKDYKYFAVRVNQEVFELTHKLTENCEIIPLTLADFDTACIYKASLRFIVALAAKKIFPQYGVHFNVSVSMSYFCNFLGGKNHFTQKEFELLKAEVERIIKADLPITKKTLSTKDAIELFEKEGMSDKVKILKYREEKAIDVYECDGYHDYLYSQMVPSTGYCKTYELRLYSPGFLVRYPRSDHNGEIPPFEDDRTFRKVLVEANDWSNLSGSTYISNINDIIEGGQALEYINMCECRHNRQLVRLVDEIEKNIRRIKIICVAGPSSSGKTTFTNRVRMELKSRGLEPLMISMDDFYLHESLVPKDEEGKPDFEHIDGLDLPYFDDCILKLTQGDEVQLPQWNFKEQKRTLKDPVTLEPGHPILIEGIHGLNDKIAPSIPDNAKFKIFISPLSQSNIDDHTPISLTDLRLIRRMIRDFLTRGVECERTFFLWPSVRKGEFKWIYPNLRNADFIFNTQLDYELCVFKKNITELLGRVKENSVYFTRAKQLKEFLSLYKEITYKWIPCTSILREFIGDSIFYTEDKI